MAPMRDAATAYFLNETKMSKRIGIQLVLVAPVSVLVPVLVKKDQYKGELWKSG